ncbi:MAG TPA: tetratricopeptide repeat protein [Gemmatimonadaceae bacterium]|jgi:TolB-like protein/predicted small secreted protein
MRTTHLAALAAASLAVSACATTISGSAQDISRLEQQHAGDPQSEPLQRSLGIAYFKANRLPDARTALEKATTMDKNDGVAALYLGMTAEAQNDLPAAEDAYKTYLVVGKTRNVKNQIRDRMESLKLRAIQAQAKAALANESGAVAGPANTVAVMPFQFTGADTSLRPIERGFAELVTTDLSRVSRLTVLERDRIQSLLDEIQLQQRQGVTAGTGVRAGKMLKVGRMVGGSIQQDGFQLRTNAVVTDVATASIGPTAQDSRSEDDIFTMEKNIVLTLLQNMGITPSTAERNAIEQRPTRSLAAFLAFSHGLELEDRGLYAEAAREFDRAVRLDPSFAAAAQKGQEARGAVSGAAVTTASVETALKGTTEGGAAAGGTTTTTTANTQGGATAIAEGLNPSMPGTASFGGTTSTSPLADPSAGTGKDNPTGQTARVTITIKQP